PRASSDNIAMPSNPRKDSTATAVAASTNDQPKVSGLYSGSHVQRPSPEAMAHAPMPRKTNSTISSPTNMIQVNAAVIRTPRELMIVLTATKPTSHTHTGTAGMVAFIATDATRYSSDGTRM